MCCISDIRDLELPKTCETEFPDPDDLLNFKLVISPDEVRRTKLFGGNLEAVQTSICSLSFSLFM